MQARVVFMSFIFLNLRCQQKFLDNKQNSNKKNWFCSCIKKEKKNKAYCLVKKFLLEKLILH